MRLLKRNSRLAPKYSILEGTGKFHFITALGRPHTFVSLILFPTDFRTQYSVNLGLTFVDSHLNARASSITKELLKIV